MMDFINVILISILIFLIYWNFKFKKYPPGPMPIPILGNILILKKLCRQYDGFPNATQELCKQYNADVISLTIAGGYTIVVQKEKNVNDVFRKEVFLGRPDNFFTQLRSIGMRKGITMTDGAFWKEQRSFVMKHLHEHGFGTRKMEYMLQRQCKELLLDFENSNVSNLHLRKNIAKCVLNVLWEVVTGSPFDDDSVMDKLMSLMDTRAKAFDMSGGLLTQFPWIRYILPNYSGYNLIQDLNNNFKQMIMETINDHKKSYKKDISRDFIDAFLHEMYQKKSVDSTFTDEQLVMLCLDFFIGGSQTTSSLLDFSFLYVAIHQDIQERVQKELDSILLPGQTPSIGDREKCPFLEAVLLEVQRLSPVTPVLGPRRNLSDTYINGYFIPKNTTIFINVQSVYEDPEIWEEPKKFKPERFLNDEGRLKQEHRLYTFGKGKRRCPAETLAKSSLFIFFSSVLHNYKLVPANENVPLTVKQTAGIIASPAPYCIKLIKRLNCK